MRVRHQAEDQTHRKFVFMIKWQKSGTWKVLVKSFLVYHFHGHGGKRAEGFEGVHAAMVLGKKCRRLLEFCDEKELCVANTWFYKADKKKKKSLILLVDVEQKLILCLWEKIQKVCKRCDFDSMRTSAETGDRRLEGKGFKKIVRKKRIIRNIWKLNKN